MKRSAPPLSLIPRASLCSTLLLLALLSGPGPARAQSKSAANEQLTVALSAPGKPGVLHVRLIGGSINVTGYNGKDVLIEAEGGTRRPSRGPAPEGLRRVDTGSNLDLSVEEKDNHVYVKAPPGNRTVNLTIKVPQRFSLRVATVQDGDISVSNVDGELEINNVNGGIALTQVAGSAVANTVNGPITASFRDVTAGAPMAFSTVNGKVDLSLPAKTKASLKLKSDFGEVYSDFELVTEQKQAKTSRNTDGMYRLNVDEWTYGKLNGGGAEILLKSLQGDIYIRRTK
ncbi:DUF4097 domain-containing protein [Hymenobacter sp. 15J16-1T3B]|uniref:DUF4097 family beta strand repeat-containing protein n=1 Tax=Hymenobacter sp. 15J16-1T3B TaxID=2886941 RepID=UPI001D0F9F20|nr:DUF4097 family beta strand repeat-containing protein [Hymenobacter sp. 15J16-1T3B]MCC3157425.1 DUF4097 domain-containing protein [Hymenobacter sp. 15J16-1T3B]